MNVRIFLQSICIILQIIVTVILKILDNHQQNSKDVLQELENIDGKADNVGIAFVKINDLELVDEYNLASVPAIVYFRYATPILYQGTLNNLRHFIIFIFIDIDFFV